jgi:hypothetical protein
MGSFTTLRWGKLIEVEGARAAGVGAQALKLPCRLIEVWVRLEEVIPKM